MKNLWVPVSAGIAQQRKVEVIANNVANANTIGFKKDDLVFKEHLTALEKGLEDIDVPNKEFSPDDFYHSQGAENAYVKVDGSFTDFKQGDLSPTENPLDMGLRGNGLFEILTPNGIRFSRNGVFSISADGFLVNNRGHRVLKSLNPGETTPAEERGIRMPQTGRISVSMDGQIFANNAPLEKISVVEFHDINTLRKEGETLFINSDINNIKRENVQSSVHQGFVEQSNVNAMLEMSELIKAHRHFETIQNVIKNYDSMAGKGANDLGRF